MKLAVAGHDELLSRRDLAFLLYDWLDIEHLTARPRYADQSRDVYDDVLELAERIATERFAAHNRAADTIEPRVVDGRVVLLDEVGKALTAFTEAGLIGLGVDAAVGGMQLPKTLAAAASAYFHAANAGTAGYALLTTAAANMLIANATPDQVAAWVPPMVEGRYFGTMCLSEAQAGSSLADITTRAEPQGDGTYRLFGTKMWISAGEHELSENIVHLVLAKIAGGPPGVKGISLFIVPRYLIAGAERTPNDVVLAGLNHKMGYRGTVNTVLGFGEGRHRPAGSAGAVGYLVGEPHRGLAYMFRMMNEARIAIGLVATALGFAGYLRALRYARARPQGRPAVSRDPATPQVPIIEHADVRRMLLAQKSYVEGAMALVLYCERLRDDVESIEEPSARDRDELLLDLLTPIAKSWPSQWCLEANSLAIQVHGGYGYSREYDVEQLYRDNRLNSIHEGTHGIQALDLLGRKVTMRDGAAFALLAERITATVDRARARGGEPAALADELGTALARLADVTRALSGCEDRERALSNATLYLEAVGHIVVAWLWLEQFLACADRDGEFYDGKRQAARFFFRHELPRTGPQLDLLARLDPTTLDMDPAWF
jgi:butyryl-CoA dehydrogenase